MHGVDRDRWLSAPNEARYNHGIQDRLPQHQNPLSHFLAVARRSQPLIPPFFDGPLEDFPTRLIACWDAHGSRDAYLYEEKRALVMAAADYVTRLPIAQFMSEDQYVRHVQGHEFFRRPSQPRPFEVPLSNSKATLRTELVEALWILTTLFHSVGIYTPPPPAPEGHVAYIPYYADADVTAAPKRGRAADLARAAMFFRRTAGLPSHRQIFSLFQFDRRNIKCPQPAEATPLSKEYYQQGAGVEIGTVQAKEQAPFESGVAYFVAKLMEMRDAKEAVRGPCFEGWHRSSYFITLARIERWIYVQQQFASLARDTHHRGIRHFTPSFVLEEPAEPFGAPQNRNPR
jgi:hypothetical protein